MGKDKSNLVVDDIFQYIRDHQLHPGDKLPSEEELTEKLGVSRVCVREGLRGLKFLGLLKASTSRGTILQNMDFEMLTRCLGFQIAIDDNSFYQLLKARLALEIGVIEQICGHLTKAQIAELEKYADCTEKDDSPAERTRRIEQDHRFHDALFRACGNPIFIHFARLLQIFFIRKFPTSKVIERATPAKEHKLILEALKNDNLDLARGLMKLHLMKYENRLKSEEMSKMKSESKKYEI